MVKDEVLARLERERGTLVSGGELSRALGVSRNAVWKAVSALRAEGSRITALPRAGYRLEEDDDGLSAAAVSAHLYTGWLGRELTVLPSVQSTNLWMKAAAAAGAPHGAVVAAETQQGGRGRRGRAFFSPPGTGLYMSLLLRPPRGLPPIHFVTLLAAVTVCKALEDETGLSPAIKWVNDVLVHGKKVCGILTEASVEGESGAFEYIVTGIGINVRTPTGGFPPPIAAVAGALDGPGARPCRRAALLAAVLNHFERGYDALLAGGADALLEEYRVRLLLGGRRATVVDGPRSYEARLMGLTDQGHLLVEDGTGATRTLAAGEITLRLNGKE